MLTPATSTSDLHSAPHLGMIPDSTFARSSEKRERQGTTVPNTESAKKRVRQTSKLHARNLWRKRRIKEASGEFIKAVASGDAGAAEKAMRVAAQTIDKIAAKGTIHKNTASRRKSRMAAKLASLTKK